MKRSTLRTLLILCLLLDLALIGVVLYDYFQNEQDWIVSVLIAFAVFVVITAILAMMKGEDEPVKVVERIVVQEAAPVEKPLEFREIRTIPPAPIRVLAENPPRRIASPPRPAVAAEPRTPTPSIPFIYNGYTLFHKDVRLKNGGHRVIYFFSKRKPKSGSKCAKPIGYHVGVNERTGLPFLKKGRGADGEDLTPATPEPGYRPQCSALTEEGKQCRNSARADSKYCGSHFGYQPPVLAKTTVDRTDTVAAVKDAPDTKPSTRKNWFGRRKKASA